MAHVFLSYARPQRDVAELLRGAFRDRGIEVWFDRDIEPGEHWSAAIEDALRTASGVVVLWSASAKASRWVLREARFAERHSTLIPVVLEGVDPPLEFDHVQTVDLTDWDGDREDPSFLALLRAVTAAASVAPAPAPSPQPSPLRLLDLGSHPRIAGAPSLDDLEKELRDSPLRRAHRRKRWQQCGIGVLAAAIFVICLLATHGVKNKGETAPYLVFGLLSAFGAMASFMTALAGGIPDLDFRGFRAGAPDGPAPPPVDAVPVKNPPPLVFVTEGVRHHLTEDDEWELTILFSLFNRGNEELVVFDVHANVYALHGQPLPPGDVSYRETLSIYETNSMLRSGRRVVVPPGGSDALRLRLRLSRAAGSLGMQSKQTSHIFSVFGIFIDVHAPVGGTVVDYRLPSDALYCFFSNANLFDAVAPASLRAWASAGTPGRAELAAKLVPLLRRHREAVSRIAPHVAAEPAPGEDRRAAWLFRAALAMNAVVFWTFYATMLAIVLAVMFRFTVQIGGGAPVRIVRFPQDAVARMRTVGDRVRHRLSQSCPEGELAQFFCRGRYLWPTTDWWGVVTAPRDMELPRWLPAATRAELLRARAEAGFAGASSAAVLVPRPMLPDKAQTMPFPRWIVLLCALSFVAMFLGQHIRALRALAAEARGTPDREGDAGGAYTMAILAALLSLGVGPSLAPFVATTCFVIATVTVTAMAIRARRC